MNVTRNFLTGGTSSLFAMLLMVLPLQASYMVTIGSNSQNHTNTSIKFVTDADQQGITLAPHSVLGSDYGVPLSIDDQDNATAFIELKTNTGQTIGSVNVVGQRAHIDQGRYAHQLDVYTIGLNNPELKELIYSSPNYFIDEAQYHDDYTFTFTIHDIDTIELQVSDPEWVETRQPA